MSEALLDSKGIEQREQILDILLKCKRGHIGSAFSVQEIIRVLYDDILRFDSKKPDWTDRDRFVLSKGHGCLALYVVLEEKGFISKKDLYEFCSETGILGGHPEHLTVPGVEASTGSLGHGLSIAVGMALAGKIDRSDYRVIAVVGDGECNEGSIWEAALSASKHQLSNLTILVDYNKMQCYSTTKEVLDLEPLRDKWESFNFSVQEVDGHDISQIRTALKKAVVSKVPEVVICHTLKGKGIPELEQNPKWHHKARATVEELEPLVQSLRNCNA